MAGKEKTRRVRRAARHTLGADLVVFLRGAETGGTAPG